MDNQAQYQKEYEEIDLMDYIKVILRRKGIILSFCLITLAAVGVFSLFQTKIYKGVVILEGGTMGGNAIESPNQIVGEINSDIYKKLVQNNLNISDPGILKIKSTNPINTNLIRIEVEYSDRQAIKNVLEEMTVLTLQDQGKEIQTKQELLGKRIEFLENNTSIYQKDIEIVKGQIKSLEQEKNNLEDREKTLEQLSPYQQINQSLTGSLFVLLDVREKISTKQQEIESLSLRMNDFTTKLNDSSGEVNLLKEQLNSIRPARIVTSSDVFEKPIKPRVLINIFIAAILGLFIGLILAFCQEWWTKAKRAI